MAKDGRGGREAVLIVTVQFINSKPTMTLLE